MKKMMSRILTIFVFLFSTLWLTQALAADSAPVALLQSLSDQMINGLKSHQATLKTHPGYVYSLARRVVVPHADLDEMSKRVLPARTWMQATPAQRSEFKKEFTTTLIRTYASALAEYKDETVNFYPVRGGSGNSVKVDSQIVRTDGPSISVSYRLINKGAGWKLVDMTVEGVSMLESFRSQFADKLNSEDMGSLIKDISTHNSANGND